MNARIGIDLSPGRLRAVRLDGWVRPRVSTAELDWTPATLAEAVATLRDKLGPASRVALSVDIAFLYAKYVKLPPLPAPEKRRIVTLEPERFFPVRAEDLVLSIRDEDNLVFAGRESLLAGWVAALAPLGTLDRIEPAPVALARALAGQRLDHATVLFPDHESRVGIVEMRRGQVGRVQRVGGTAAEVAAAMAEDGMSPPVVYATSLNGDGVGRLAGALRPTQVQLLPAPPGMSAAHLPAYGAALGIGRDLGGTLLPGELAGRITRRRRVELALAVLACFAAVAFGVSSLDSARDRVLEETEKRVADLRTRTAPVLALQGRAEELARTARGIAAIERGRTDPGRVLLALSERLPRDAYLQAARGTGAEWQIDGFARDAASLVPLLEGDPRFENVRFLSATNRLPSGSGAHESFSIALHFVATP